MNRIIIAIFFTLSLAAFGQAPGTAAAINGRQAKALEAKAKSKEDHRQLANFYRAQATRETAEAEKHLGEAESYRLNPAGVDAKHPMSYRTEAHCRLLAARYAKAAAQSGRKASGHERLISAAPLR